MYKQWNAREIIVRLSWIGLSARKTVGPDDHFRKGTGPIRSTVRSLLCFIIRQLSILSQGKRTYVQQRHSLLPLTRFLRCNPQIFVDSCQPQRCQHHLETARPAMLFLTEIQMCCPATTYLHSSSYLHCPGYLLLLPMALHMAL